MTPNAEPRLYWFHQAAEATFADTSSSSASSREAGFTGFEANAADSTGQEISHREGQGWIPSADAARTSPKFIAHDDTEGAASWEEEFFFERVFGETTVRIVCVDKVWEGRGARGKEIPLNVCFVCSALVQLPSRRGTARGLLSESSRIGVTECNSPFNFGSGRAAS